MGDRISRADAGLLPVNYGRLNDAFYECKPWVHFDRRVVQLARVAANARDQKAPSDCSYRVGGLTIREERRQLDDDEPWGLDDQAFVAAEAQVLQHHVSETLLRLVHAHAPDEHGTYPPCPWLAMSRVKHPGVFKDWVRSFVVKSSADEAADLARAAFGASVADELSARNSVGWLQIAAEHFLDADSYNAAKHGFALQGAHSRLTVEPDKEADGDGRSPVPLIDEQGLTVTWLGVRGAPNPKWSVTTRWFSVDATVAIAYLTTRLIEALWYAGRARYLAEPQELVWDPPAIADVLAACGVVHPVLAERDEVLAYEGIAPTLLIRTHLRTT